MPQNEVVCIIIESDDEEEDADLQPRADDLPGDLSSDDSGDNDSPEMRKARRMAKVARRVLRVQARAEYRAARLSSKSTLQEGDVTSGTENSLDFFFPVVNDLNAKFRGVTGRNNSASKIMKVVQGYIEQMRELQKKVHQYPNKSHLVAKHVGRTMILIRGLNKHLSDVRTNRDTTQENIYLKERAIQTHFYIQKMVELLAIYMFLELRFASGFTTSKVQIAEKIITNIHLHLEFLDISYILRIFAYIPYMGKDPEIVQKIIKRLIPNPGPAYLPKRELNDRLYVQYLIAFYHWRDAELLDEDKEKVVAFANRFMKPMSTLKSSPIYAVHLPCYDTRENATRYFLENMVFFDDLRNASLMDKSGDPPLPTIDLSDDDEPDDTDYSVFMPDEPVPILLNTVKLEEQHVIASYDLTQIDRRTEYIQKLARKAMEVELNNPRFISPSVRAVAEVFTIDSSDDEMPREDANRKKKKSHKPKAGIECDSNHNYDSLYDQLDMSMDVPDEDFSEDLLQTVHVDTERSEESPAVSHHPEEITAHKDLMCSRLNSENKNINSVQENKSVTEFISDVIAPISVIPEQLTEEEDVGDGGDSTFSECGVQNSNTELIDNSEVTREAVTLSLDTYSDAFESYDESEGPYLTHFSKPTLKTYSRKPSNKPLEFMLEKPADVCPVISEECSSEIVDRTDNVTTNENEDREDVVIHNSNNILFSSDVTPSPLDDASEGNQTPSYIKVPDVETSKQVSNVVFSMQGRRLSSFPALEATSSLEPTMPDFDAEFSTEGEEGEVIEDNLKQRLNTISLKSNIRTKDSIDSDKTVAKRRSVWFSDTNEVHVIEPRQAPISDSSLNNINSAINSLRGSNNQQQSFDNVKCPKSSTTATTTSEVMSISNSTIPRTSTTTSPKADTEALRIAQEQELVQRLFPELFKNSKNSKRKHSKATTVVKESAKNSIIKKKNTNTITDKIKTTLKSPTKITRNITPTPSRCKSVTPIPGKPVLSEFDRYLENLKKRRTKDSTPLTDRNKKEKSHKLRNKHKTNKQPINVITKSLVDLTQDVKLTRKRPVVIVDRLTKKMLISKLCPKLKPVEERSGILYPKLTHSVPEIEYLVKLPAKQAPLIANDLLVAKLPTVRAATKSLSDILSDVVEQESISSIGKQQQSSAVEELGILAGKADKVTSKRSLETDNVLSVGLVRNQPDLTKPCVQKPPDDVELKKLEVKVIKLEQVDSEMSKMNVNPRRHRLKKPMKSITLRYGYGLERCTDVIQAPVSSPLLTDAESIHPDCLSDRLEASPSNTDELDSVKFCGAKAKAKAKAAEVVETAAPENIKIPSWPKTLLKVRLKRWNLASINKYIFSRKYPAKFSIEDSDDSEYHSDLNGKPLIRDRIKDRALLRIFIHMVDGISDIDTPPPTPPPMSPTPNLDTEPNNNQIQQRTENWESMLANYVNTSADIIQEFRDHANISPQIPVDSEFLAVFYKYLVRRKDVPAKQEIVKMVPLISTKIFGSVDLSAAYLRKRKTRLKMLAQRRRRNYSSSEVSQEDPSNKSSRSSLLTKRRKTICSDSHYLAQSPDFIFDEEICSPNQSTESPTAEVMRLHTARRYGPSRPTATVVLPNVTEEEPQVQSEEIVMDTVSGTQSPQLFSDYTLSSPMLPQIMSPDSIAVPSSSHTESECPPQSPSTRTNCESPPDTSRNLVVSRTYSKSYMVHVFVPPEIEKCIEEQASTIVQSTRSITLPSSSKRPSRSSSGSKARKIRRNMDTFSFEEDNYDEDAEDHEEENDDDDNNDDEDYKKKSQNKKVKRKTTTTSVRRARQKSKTSSHSIKSLKKQ